MKTYLNLVKTAVPENDVHGKFVEYAFKLLKTDRDRKVFKRMADRSQIDHRFSIFKPSMDLSTLDRDDFYKADGFPSTASRMKLFQDNAFTLAKLALDKLDFIHRRKDITHIIVTTCTGFYAPGIDLQIIEHYGLNPAIERTLVGFMGCYAAVNALKLAHHIVRSRSDAQILILNLELCTLHLKNASALEQVLSFLIFADGCSAGIVSAKPVGLELKSFHASVIPESQEQITWNIGEFGFDMILSGKVPKTISSGLPGRIGSILNGTSLKDVRYWAVHPGGRTVLDAVEQTLDLPSDALAISREVLRHFGNMSSATLMFVLREVIESDNESGTGCAMAFGPGVTVESMMFEKLGR